MQDFAHPEASSSGFAPVTFPVGLLSHSTTPPRLVSAAPLIGMSRKRKKCWRCPKPSSMLLLSSLEDLHPASPWQHTEVPCSSPPVLTVVAQAELPSGLSHMEVEPEAHHSADGVTVQGPVAPFSDMDVLSNAELLDSSVINMGVSPNGAKAVSPIQSSLPPPSHLLFCLSAVCPLSVSSSEDREGADQTPQGGCRLSSYLLLLHQSQGTLSDPTPNAHLWMIMAQMKAMQSQMLASRWWSLRRIVPLVVRDVALPFSMAVAFSSPSSET